MSRAKFKVAVGSPDAPFSGVWHIFSHKDDVYFGASKLSLKMFKFSLHGSGVWTLAATEQSGITFDNGNRRAKRWTRPDSHAPGVTRGPSIVVPHTSLGSRRLAPSEVAKTVTWFPAPASGHAAMLTFYYVNQGVTLNLKDGEALIGEVALSSGTDVGLVGSISQPPAQFLTTVEGLLRNNVVKYKDPSDHLGGSFLWMSESADDLKTPFIVDLPVPVARE